MELNREVGEIRTQLRFMTLTQHEMQKDIKSLLAFKWQILGVSSLASFVGASLVTSIAEYFLGRMHP